MNKSKFNISVFIVSLLFTIFSFAGYAIQRTGTIDMLFSKNILLKIIIFFGLLFIYYLIVIFLYYLFDKMSKDNSKESKLYYFIFNKKPILIPFLIFFVSGLWYVICFYPGAVQWDGLGELNYFFGIHPWTMQHPILPTILIGLCVKIGRFILNDNFGVFIFNFTEYIISCLIFAYLVSYQNKVKAPRPFVWCTFFFFIINPVWHANGYTLIKDTYFYLFFIIFFISYINYYHDKGNNITLTLSALMIILFRNNGIHIIIVSLLFLLIFKKNNRLVTILIMVILLSINSFVNLVAPLTGIYRNNIRESLAVPIQMTARYIKYANLSKDEEEFYSKIFMVSLDKVRENYLPESADGVKFSFELGYDKRNYHDYLKYWLTGFKKEPKIYFDAYLASYYGYFYPLIPNYLNEIGYFDIIASKQVNTGYFNLYMNSKTEKVRNIFYKYIDKISSMPVIELTFHTATYTWILIIILGYALNKKKYDALIISIPLLCILGFCFLSPVNAYIRYINPLIVTLPILYAYVLNNNFSK